MINSEGGVHFEHALFFVNASMFHADVKNVSDCSLFAGCDISHYDMKQNSLA
jgi:hypothetical protein